jgi:hypothetical protein
MFTHLLIAVVLLAGASSGRSEDQKTNNSLEQGRPAAPTSTGLQKQTKDPTTTNLGAQAPTKPTTNNLQKPPTSAPTK